MNLLSSTTTTLPTPRPKSRKANSELERLFNAGQLGSAAAGQRMYGTGLKYRQIYEDAHSATCAVGNLSGMPRGRRQTDEGAVHRLDAQRKLDAIDKALSPDALGVLHRVVLADKPAAEWARDAGIDAGDAHPILRMALRQVYGKITVLPSLM